MVTVTLSVVAAVLLLINITQAITGVRQAGRLYNERRKVAFLERALIGHIIRAELADDDEECDCACCGSKVEKEEAKSGNNN